MSYGQPFYNYANTGYMPYQAPNYNPYAQQTTTMSPNARNQAMNGFYAQAQANTQPQVQQQQQPPQGVIMPPKSNKIYVTGIEDATSRVAEPNTEICYRHQDKPIFYEVYTDLQGKKTVKEYRYEEVQGEPKQEENVTLDEYIKKEEFAEFTANYVTKNDLAELENKFSQLLKQATTSTTSKAKKQPEPTDKGE